MIAKGMFWLLMWYARGSGDIIAFLSIPTEEELLNLFLVHWRCAFSTNLYSLKISHSVDDAVFMQLKSHQTPWKAYQKLPRWIGAKRANEFTYDAIDVGACTLYSMQTETRWCYIWPAWQKGSAAGCVAVLIRYAIEKSGCWGMQWLI